MFRDGLRDIRVWVKRTRPEPGPSVPKTKVYETLCRGWPWSWCSCSMGRWCAPTPACLCLTACPVERLCACLPAWRFALVPREPCGLSTLQRSAQPFACCPAWASLPTAKGRAGLTLTRATARGVGDDPLRGLCQTAMSWRPRLRHGFRGDRKPEDGCSGREVAGGEAARSLAGTQSLHESEALRGWPRGFTLSGRGNAPPGWLPGLPDVGPFGAARAKRLPVVRPEAAPVAWISSPLPLRLGALRAPLSLAADVSTYVASFCRPLRGRAVRPKAVRPKRQEKTRTFPQVRCRLGTREACAGYTQDL